MGLTGGVFGIDSTTGQADAGGPWAGGTLGLHGGFWSLVASAAALQADLSLSKSDGQASSIPGLPVTYTITAANAGPFAVSGATVQDAPPVILSNVAWTCTATPGSSCPASGSGAINASVSLAVGGSASFSLTGRIDPAATGSVANSASVAVPSGVLDPNGANNAATDTNALTPQADLAVALSDSPDPVANGGSLTYTLQVTNVGPSVVPVTTLRDTLPGLVSFVSSTPGAPTCSHASGVVTCNLGGLAPAANATVTMLAAVSPGAAGILTNSASVVGGVPDPVVSNNQDTETTQVLLRARAELAHGTDVRSDLRGVGPAANVHLYRISQKPFASYEIVVDSTSGDIGVGAGPLVERVAPDGLTVLQTSQPIGAGVSRSLRFENGTSTAVEDQLVRVRSASCASDCGPEDVYRLRAWETTGSITRFNNSATQITVVVLFNRSPQAVTGHVRFWSTSGASVHTHPFTLSGRESLILNTSAALAGQSGSITVTHDGPRGLLTGKAVALEPETGLSFDSVLEARPR